MNSYVSFAIYSLEQIPSIISGDGKKIKLWKKNIHYVACIMQAFKLSKLEAKKFTKEIKIKYDMLLTFFRWQHAGGEKKWNELENYYKSDVFKNKFNKDFDIFLNKKILSTNDDLNKTNITNNIEFDSNIYGFVNYLYELVPELTSERGKKTKDWKNHSKEKSLLLFIRDLAKEKSISPCILAKRSKINYNIFYTKSDVVSCKREYFDQEFEKFRVQS